MSHFPQIEDTTGNPELEDAYRTAREAGWLGPDGKLLNFVTAYSEKPNILQGILDLESRVGSGSVPPTVKQMIGMTVSNQNECPYCENFAAGALEAMGVPNSVIQSCASDPDLAEVPPPQRAIIRFALKMSRDPSSISGEDIDGLREFGMSDGEILEVMSAAAMSNFYNLLTSAMGVVVEGKEDSSS